MANGSQFGLNIDAILNTNNVPKQLEELNARLKSTTSTMVKIPVGFDIETGKKVFGEFIKDTRKYVDEMGNSFKRITISDPFSGLVKSDKIQKVTDAVVTLTTETKKFTDSSGDLNKWITKFDEMGQVVQTRTKEYTDSFGRLVKETSDWGKNANDEWVQISDTVKNISEDLTQFDNVVTHTSKSIDKYKTDLGATVTVINEVNKQGEQFKTIITEEVDEQGKLIKTTEKWNEASHTLISTHKEVINDQIKLKNEQEKLRKSLEKTIETATHTSKSVKKYTTELGATVTVIREVNKAGEEFKTVITEEVDAENQIIKTTERWNETTHTLISTHKELIDDQTKLREEQQKTDNVIQNSITSVHKYVSELGNVVTVTTDFNDKNEKIITTVIEEDNGLGKLQRTTKVYNDTLKQTVKTEIQLINDETKATQTEEKRTDATEKATHSTQKLAQSTKQAAVETKTFGQQLSDAITRLARYYIASMPIQMVRKGIQEAITTVKEFDSALIEFRKVSDLAGESLTRYVAKLAEMGEVTGSTMQAMVEASTEFRKSGFTDEDSAKLASIAEKYRNIADEEISAGESASFIIAQMKAFNIEAGQAEHIIDSVNEV